MKSSAKATETAGKKNEVRGGRNVCQVWEKAQTEDEEKGLAGYFTKRIPHVVASFSYVLEANIIGILIPSKYILIHIV